jgi:hypothetical protein
MKAIAIVSITLACSLLTVSVGAKGKTVKLVVSGGALQQPIEISGKDVLFANPWGEEFVHPWTAMAEPPQALGRYEVSFYEELGPGNVQMKYVVDFVPSLPGRGAIHLPGRGDARYRLNVGTILRDGRDGRWFPASDAWERVVGSRLR